jgi:NAD(P)-dependent dehydrogenase (short-subunit alcohol dehydrogenase family)
MPNTIIVTGVSSGFGALTSRALADAGHLVYAGIRSTTGHNAPADAAAYARDHEVALRTVELDVSADPSGLTVHDDAGLLLRRRLGLGEDRAEENQGRARQQW